MLARFGFGADNRRGPAAAVKMPDPQDDYAPKESHLHPTCKPDAPINADLQYTVYLLQAHASEEPVEQSANALGRREIAENHSATSSDIPIQRLDMEYGNGRQDSSDISSLADEIDSICDESE
jgi:hypothetical protein